MSGLYVEDGYVVAGYILESFLTNEFNRTASDLVTLTLDRCENTYGVAPCTANAGTGNECYNTFPTCQDQANYVKGSSDFRFCGRGTKPTPGELTRPYVIDIQSIPTEIVPNAGLALRAQTKIKLANEACRDNNEDPYYSTRPQEASGTFWGRWIARNKNYANRPAMVRRGLLTSGESIADVTPQMFLIANVTGPTKGQVTVSLQDAIALLDKSKLPVPTDGQLITECPAISNTGVAQSGGASTITLASAASAVDDFYNGQEVYITQNTGAGQRRTISDYVGATRVATVSVAWSVTPDSTSVYEVSPLSITLDTDKGAQYADPAVTLRQEYVRIGAEIIEYTSISGDVLSWDSSEKRAQFGTPKEDHGIDDSVQQCLAFIDESPADVIERLINGGGLDSSYIDLVQLADETDTWSPGMLINAVISEPEQVSALLSDILIDLNAMVWWDALAQQVKYKVNSPALGDLLTIDDNDIIFNSLKIDRLDRERITRQAIYFGLRDATEDIKLSKNYFRAFVYLDSDAESINEYGDERPAIRYSRWLSIDNASQAASFAARTLGSLRDAPEKISFMLDHKDALQVGDLIDLDTRHREGPDGFALRVSVRVVRVENEGNKQSVTVRTTAFADLRAAYVSPDGLPDYNSATELQRQTAFIADVTGKMTNGDPAYLII